MYQDSSYTHQGLEAIARIVKVARGSLSVREFARKTDISYSVISKLENLESKLPSLKTFEKLAPHTPYSLEELIAIATQRTPQEPIEIRTAEDLLPHLSQLPLAELGRLMQLVGELVISKSSGT